MGNKPIHIQNMISNFNRLIIPLLALITSLLCSASCSSWPANILATETDFQNWARDIDVKNLKTAYPKNSEEVLQICNWAYQNGYNVRASGYMHNWSPITVSQADNASKIILVKTTKLNKAKVQSTNLDYSSVWTQTGLKMTCLMTLLEKYRYGFTATPAPGDITVGGVLAICGHGTGVPSIGESNVPGNTYGSLCNLVINFTAVVWDPTCSCYVLKNFTRNDEEASAFFPGLGRTFITDVVLQVGKMQNLRCQSFIDIPISELLADPFKANETTRTLSSFLDTSGRVEIILYPFTTYPWLKVWSIAEVKPAESREVTSPFNYPFSDFMPLLLTALIASIVAGNWYLVPVLGASMVLITAIGLVLFEASDIWGPPKNTLLYIKPSTLRMTANGILIITKRQNVQQILFKSYDLYQSVLNSFTDQCEFPVNGPMEIRVTGLDYAQDVLFNTPDAQPPFLSALFPTENTEFNVAVWLDILTMPQTPLASKFFLQIQDLFSNAITPDEGKIRYEWSKGWGYSNDSGYSNATAVQLIRESYPQWNVAKSVLNKYDPNNLFWTHVEEIIWNN